VVHKATEAVDAGLVVNPDGAEAQLVGGMTMGLSAVLQEKIEIRDGMVGQQNFNQYPLLTMERVPDFDVVFVDSELPPKGLGEPPLFPVAAAMGNAIFNLTGKRLREFPFTPDAIRSA
jgi:isoquinoline 1-oxidoreductase beta subunit